MSLFVLCRAGCRLAVTTGTGPSAREVDSYFDNGSGCAAKFDGASWAERWANGATVL